MRIERIIFKNYRQFKNAELPLNHLGNNDLHIIVGSNGTGKTNILNAVNWCLYNDEPHISKDAQILPVMNLDTLEDSASRMQKILIEIWAKGEGNTSIIFRREALSKIMKDEDKVYFEPGSFDVEVTDEEGDSELYQDERAEQYVNRFVPKRIREFFFFDGERLDRYFREATGQNIRHAIFEIAQIDLMEKMEKAFNDVLRDLRREAGSKNPQIEKARKELENKDDILNSTEEDLAECRRQIGMAKEYIKDYNEKLQGVPDVELIEKKRERLIQDKKTKKDRLNSKAFERLELLFYGGTLQLVSNCIFNSIEIIEEKKRNKELPPTHDKTLIEKTLKESVCALCGRPLEEKSFNKIEQIVKNTKMLSPEIAAVLLNMSGSLNRSKEDLANFSTKLRQIAQDYYIFENDLSEIEKEIEKIEKELSNYNAEQIKEWSIERKKLEEILELNTKKLGSLELKRDATLHAKNKCLKQLEEELQKEEKLESVINQINFCEKALSVVSLTKKQIMDETREEIRSLTKKLFFDLTWKKESFSDVSIDDSYRLSLIHSLGYECLGSLSAAERELLALSFTLALHNVSGFDSPIIIDTPVARVSDQHRENFGKALSEISIEKQIILLFTPSEYSNDIAQRLNPICSSKYDLKLFSNEKETRLEENKYEPR